MKDLTFSIVLFLFASISFAQTALIEIEFYCTNGAGGNRLLTAGLDPTAGDTIDTHLGEGRLPPRPFTFWARFQLPSSTFESWKDVRQGDTTSASVGNRIHKINYGRDGGIFSMSWDLPEGIKMNIIDPAGGTFFDSTYTSGPGNFTEPVISFNTFTLTIQYNEAPFPVELISFSAKYHDNYVILNWETVTEVNNYGFDIERSIKSGENEEPQWVKLGFIEGNGNSNSPKQYSFTDKNPFGGSRYVYRLKQFDTDGTYDYSDEVEVELVPTKYELYQNYPNPFNPNTTIRYQLPKESNVVIKIFDILGAEVITLLDEKKEPGVYGLELNLQNLSSGTYIYRIVTGEFVDTKKMMLFK